MRYAEAQSIGSPPILILMSSCGAHSWGPGLVEAPGSVGVAVTVAVAVAVAVAVTVAVGFDDADFDDDESDPQPATTNAAVTMRPTSGAKRGRMGASWCSAQRWASRTAVCGIVASREPVSSREGALLVAEPVRLVGQLLLAPRQRGDAARHLPRGRRAARHRGPVLKARRVRTVHLNLNGGSVLSVRRVVHQAARLTGDEREAPVCIAGMLGVGKG